MTLENAQRFVSDLRESNALRQSACLAAENRELATFLSKNGYTFELHHLVPAMAACMDEMATAMENTNQPT